MPKNKKDYSQYLFYGMAGFAVLLLIYNLLVSKMFQAAVVISIFIFLSAVLSSYKRFIKLPIEIEILTLGIVVCTINFGVKAGLIVAIIGGILSFIVGFNISPFSLPMLLGYVSIAFTSFILRDFNITLVGIIASIVNNILVFVIYNYAFEYDIFKNLGYSISNLAFNIILFLNIVPLIAGWIS
jgi:hypothetical protein